MEVTSTRSPGNILRLLLESVSEYLMILSYDFFKPLYHLDGTAGGSQETSIGVTAEGWVPSPG